LNIEQLDEYAKYLRRNAAEVTSLRKDLLIGVTEFFAIARRGNRWTPTCYVP